MIKQNKKNALSNEIINFSTMGLQQKGVKIWQKTYAIK